MTNAAYPSVPKTFPLPATGIPAEIRATLHPWIAGFIGRTPAQATRRLHERWETIARPALLALRNVLAEFEVRAIVEHDEGGMIYAVRPGYEEDCVGNSFFLPAPIDPDVLAARLDSVALSWNAAVREFMSHFAGLAEDNATAGNFVYLNSPWPRFTDSWEGSIEGFDEWENSLMLYGARNGCHVLVHPRGNVAWWIMQERRVEELAADFDTFVMKFCEHRRLAWPYDPYGPPDQARWDARG